ncbi:major allergen Pru ar 1-like [Syzygium oleosum]|uniref:major allergen Pru ar 1-like n=1 Tax=Syzygium oleosum TaxID=219896 RepID=UPI0024B9FE0F|nr:major allergen Pru ar 1-like [Syzygium oleosum]
MGVITYSQEVKSAIAPSRMFKALIIDSHNVIIPERIKSVEFIEGDDGTGSIKKTNFVTSCPIKYTKNKIDAFDVDNCYCKYTLIESGVNFNKIDFIIYKVKFVVADGGSVCKMTREYHAKEGCELKEDDIKQGKDKAMGLVKTIEEYLLANPDVCA